jgi:hypothetical protein
MAKTGVRSQKDNLISDHRKSRIDPIPLRVGHVQHDVGIILTRATTSIQTSSRSEVCTRNYSFAKLWESQPWWFRDSHLRVLGQKTIWMPLPRGDAKYTIWGKVVASPESGPWWVLWIQGRPWLVLAAKVFQPCANQLVCWFCVGLLEWLNCLSLFLVPSWSSSMPLYPYKVLRIREHASSP